ncbi:MAG: DUF4942 domain-containing protein [Stenomitos frigidus ULC029]
MLENEFFPTPAHIIEKMVTPYLSQYGGYRTHLNHQRVLDPSAGAGGILDWLKEKANYKGGAYAIEINHDLFATLQGKGYRVLDRDFLKFDEPLKFDLIVMNPPFSTGVKHVLHAWHCLDDGGDLVALVNAATLTNILSKERGLLQAIIDEHGTVENLGACFKDAERKTNVEVSMIRLVKPKRKQMDFGFEDMGFTRDDQVKDEAFAANPLASKDLLKSLVAQYNQARTCLLERDRIQKMLNFYTQGISSPVYDESRHYTDREKDTRAFNTETALTDQLMLLKSRFWNTVFTKTRIGRSTTSSFQKTFSDFCVSQQGLSFTEENVREMLEAFIANRQDIIYDCLLNVFDQATGFCEKNKIHYEGWKTNKGWRLNKRIIHPYGVNYEPRWGGSFSTNYHRREFFMDLDKVLSWLSGQSIESPGFKCIQDAVEQFIHDRTTVYTDQFESTFFKIRIYKKGTIHLDFKDLDLLARFNKEAAKGKKWLGDGT